MQIKHNSSSFLVLGWKLFFSIYWGGSGRGQIL